MFNEAISYRSLIEPRVLYGEIAASQVFVRIWHVFVPQSHLVVVADIKRLLHLLLNTFCGDKQIQIKTDSIDTGFTIVVSTLHYIWIDSL